MLVRHGRFAGTSVAPRGADPWPYVDALRATGEVVQPPLLPAPSATAEEAEPGAALARAGRHPPGGRRGRVERPLHGAGGERWRLEPVERSLRQGVVGFDEPGVRGGGWRRGGQARATG
ncbi:hypothetical protein GCM10025868_43370 [Angustibacter aerolatus]|uniref:Uncharacterized protein n=1 Tax=Angustibacter aerolatus TaxID=1162965 RepID=A0ABQ6JQG6_9ACTN|nr:hypothetical protein GCM10025868_43370 [Angustibacter aerolatus]